MRRLLAVLALLALTSCALARSVVGPDPALVEVAPTLRRGLATDTQVNPGHEAENKRAGEVVGDVTAPPAPTPAPGWLQLLLAAVLTPTGAGIATAGSALVLSYLNRKSIGTVTKAVDQHADVIDAVAPESAEWAARVKPPAKPVA